MCVRVCVNHGVTNHYRYTYRHLSSCTHRPLMNSDHCRSKSVWPSLLSRKCWYSGATSWASQCMGCLVIIWWHFILRRVAPCELHRIPRMLQTQHCGIIVFFLGCFRCPKCHALSGLRSCRRRAVVVVCLRSGLSAINVNHIISRLHSATAAAAANWSSITSTTRRRGPSKFHAVSTFVYNSNKS